MFHLRSSSRLCTLRSAVSTTRLTPRRTLKPFALQYQRSDFSATASAMGKDTLTEAIKDDHEEVGANTFSLLSIFLTQQNRAFYTAYDHNLCKDVRILWLLPKISRRP